MYLSVVATVRYLVDDVGLSVAFYVERLGSESVRSFGPAGTVFRNDVVEGPGGRQILIEGPSGNPIELFGPA